MICLTIMFLERMDEMSEIILEKQYIGEDDYIEVDIEDEKTVLKNYYQDVDILLQPGMEFRTAYAWYKVSKKEG